MKKTVRPVKETARQLQKLGGRHDHLGYLTRVARKVMAQGSSEFFGHLGLAIGQITPLGLITARKGPSQNDLARAILMRKMIAAKVSDLDFA